MFKIDLLSASHPNVLFLSYILYSLNIQRGLYSSSVRQVSHSSNCVWMMPYLTTVKCNADSVRAEQSVRSSCSSPGPSPATRWWARWFRTESRHWWSRGSLLCWPPSFGSLEKIETHEQVIQRVQTSWERLGTHWLNYLWGFRWKQLRRSWNQALTSPYTWGLSCLGWSQGWE